MKKKLFLLTIALLCAVVTPEADMSLYPRYRYRYVPTWTWDEATATATLSIACSALSSEAVSVTDISYSIDGEVKTATGTYKKADGITYTFTDTYILPVESLALQDADSNEEALENNWGRKVKTLTLMAPVASCSTSVTARPPQGLSALDRLGRTRIRMMATGMTCRDVNSVANPRRRASISIMVTRS